MTDIQSTPRPAWQTDELEDEWIDDDDDQHNREDHENTFSSLSQGTRSISMTTPLAGVLHVISSADETDSSEDPTATTTTDQVGGTFLVRQDVPAAPLLPQTPGRNNKKGAIKDFFSPLPLERMFEPPSPPSPSTQPQVQTQKLIPNQPAVPSRLAREYIPDNSLQSDDTQANHTGMPTMAPFADNNHPFTFTVPRQSSNTQSPQAQSTPIPPPRAPGGGIPMTDPRLKLFQFQYDTFTRDHLSAIVDSIAVNPPSGGTDKSNKSSPSLPYASARDFNPRANPTDNTHFRSAKRVKLSREPDYGYGEGDGEGASIARPKLSGKDYLHESRKMMEQIKSARDFSTVSTTSAMGKDSVREEDGDGNNKEQDGAEARPTILRVPSADKQPPTTPFRPPIPPPNSTSSRLEKYSSLAYRKQAAELMEQIKSDMKGSKRTFSGDTDSNEVRDGEDKENDKLGPREKRAPNRAPFLTPTAASRNSRHIPTYTQRSNVKGHSPRKLSRRPSAANEVDRELADGAADMSIEDHDGGAAPVPTIPTVNGTVPGSIRVSRSRSPIGTTPSRVPAQTQQPGLLVPPTYPTNSVRLGANADLNRFVSSSTATSGTALTVGSAGSFVKHAGPGQVAGNGVGNGNIRRIAPEDVQGMLGERVGRMVYDRVMMRWVKGVAGRVGGGDGDGGEEERTEHTRASTESEDVFRDIESLREDTDGDTEQQAREEEAERMSRITETDREKDDEEADDEEEMGLTSFSFDGPSAAGVVQVMTGVDDLTTDSEDEDDRALVAEAGSNEYDLRDGFDSDEDLPDDMLPSPVAPAFSTPRPPTQPPQTPVVRGVLKSTSNTPVSALKNGTEPRNHRTPANRISHRRSVSFSDGKREGPIRGVGKNADAAAGVMGDEVRDKGAVFVPSVRSKRIADMMEDLESQDFEEDDSPTRTSISDRKSSEELQPLAVRRHNDNGHISRRIFSRSQTHRTPLHNKANATFLTECSFAVSHDRLVQVITDVEPFEPHWEKIRSINLSKKNVESVARLKEFLPKLDSLNLNSNQLAWLSGVPGTARTLSVSSNFLTGITSFSHLLNLENLDISDNDIDSIRQLECLRHLRELRADGNKITSIDGLQKMDGLVKLSLHENGIQDIDLTKFRWSRLEMLNLSRNRIDNIEGLASLPSLIALNLDDNSLGDLDLSRSMPKLRILRLSGNRLYRLNVAPFPNLRTLYADNNSLTDLAKATCLSKLENLSLRNQSGREFHLSTREIRDVKRLYLSGNALRTGFIEESCYNLVYLELAACRLSTLPSDLASLVPNLRVLNLNYNFIEDAQPLEGLSRLKKLTLIGSRLKGTKALIHILKGMPNVEMLDFRMNPCTLGWYLPLLVKDVPGALQPSEGGDKGEDQEPRGRKRTDFAWKELDSKFRRDLPDEAYIGRLAYRGLVMRACPQIQMLDGVDVSEKERAKALHLLQGISGKRKLVGRRGG